MFFLKILIFLFFARVSWKIVLEETPMQVHVKLSARPSDLASCESSDSYFWVEGCPCLTPFFIMYRPMAAKMTPLIIRGISKETSSASSILLPIEDENRRG